MEPKKSKKTNDTSSSPVQTIDSLSLQMQVVKMSEDNVALATKIRELVEIINDKDREIDHLNELLGSSTPLITSNVTKVTDEEVIAQIQLEKLKNKAMNGELSLEEAKIFDLMVKNKRLAQGNSTVNTEGVRIPTNTSRKDLRKIATFKTEAEQQSNDE